MRDFILLLLGRGIKYSLTYFSTEESVALWAQWVKVPSTPDKRSPCPPHLLGDPSAVHTKAEKSREYIKFIHYVYW